MRPPSTTLDCWIIRAAGMLQHILHARSTLEAKEIARDGLEEMADPEYGVTGIDEEIIEEWKTSVLTSRREERE